MYSQFIMHGQKNIKLKHGWLTISPSNTWVKQSDKKKQGMQYTYNVTMRLVRATIAVLEKQ